MLELLEALGLLLELLHLALVLLLAQAAVLEGLVELLLPLFHVGELLELLGHLAELFLEGLLLGLGHLALLELLLKLFELFGGLLEVALGEFLGKLVGRAVLAHFLELLELAIDLLGRAELLLPLLEGVGQLVHLHQQLVFLRRGGLGQVFGLLLDLGQQLLGLGELVLVDRLPLARDLLGERLGLLGKGLGVDLRLGLGLDGALDPGGNEEHGNRQARRDQDDPRPARQLRAERGSHVQLGELLPGVGEERVAGRGLAQIVGQGQRRADPFVEMEGMIDGHRGVEPARPGEDRDQGGNQRTHSAGDREGCPLRPGQRVIRAPC